MDIGELWTAAWHLGLLFMGVVWFQRMLIGAPERRSGRQVSVARPAVAEKADGGMTRMWCDACKHVVARSDSGQEYGHQTKWCDGGGGHLMWQLPSPEPVTVDQAIETAAELTQAADKELYAWLRENVGTTNLEPADIEMFRKHLDLITSEKDQLKRLAREMEN